MIKLKFNKTDYVKIGLIFLIAGITFFIEYYFILYSNSLFFHTHFPMLFAFAIVLAFVLEFKEFIFAVLALSLLQTLAISTGMQKLVLVVIFFSSLTICFYFIKNYLERLNIDRGFAIILELLSIFGFIHIYHVFCDWLLGIKGSVILQLKEPFILITSLVLAAATYFAGIIIKAFFGSSYLFEESFFRQIIFSPFVVFVSTMAVFASVLLGNILSSFSDIETTVKSFTLQETRDSVEIYAEFTDKSLASLQSSMRALVNLPGIQWRKDVLQALARDRINQFYTSNVESGLDSCYLVSEEGEIVLFSGLKIDESNLKTLLTQLKNRYPQVMENFRIDIYESLPIRGKLLYAMPVYRTSINPTTKEKPDYRRNGFLICQVDLESLFENVQTRLFKEGEIQFFVFKDGNEFKATSFSLNIEVLTYEERREITNKAVLLAKKSAQTGKTHTEIIDGFSAVAYPLDSVGNVYLVLFNSLKRFEDTITKKRAEILRQNYLVLILGVLLAISLFAYFAYFSSSIHRELKAKEQELEREIRERYELLETAVEDVPIGFFLFDEDGKIVYANAFGKFVIERHIGRPIETIKGTPFEAFLKVFKNKEKFLREEMAFEDRIYGCTMKVARFGNLDRAIAIVSDITETRRMQQTAMSESRKLLLGELAKNFSKITTEPLQLALSKIELFLLNRDLNEDTRKLLFEIKLELKKVIDASFGIISLSTESLQEAETQIDLNYVFKKTTDILRASFERYGINYRLKTAGKDVFIKGYYSRIEYILLTIFTLAIEALQNIEKEKSILVDFALEDDYVKIFIKHKGIVLNDDEVFQLKAPFYIAGMSGKVLNLFIAREMAERDGAQLEVFFEEGETIYMLKYPRV